MIKKQMKEMGPMKDYLTDKLPEPNLPALNSDWFKAEIERVVSSQKKPAMPDYTSQVPHPSKKTIDAYQ